MFKPSRKSLIAKFSPRFWSNASSQYSVDWSMVGSPRMNRELPFANISEMPLSSSGSKGAFSSGPAMMSTSTSLSSSSSSGPSSSIRTMNRVETFAMSSASCRPLSDSVGENCGLWLASNRTTTGSRSAWAFAVTCMPDRMMTIVSIRATIWGTLRR